MAVTASTPLELIDEVYGRLPERVAIARERLGRPLTFAEKILFNHLADPAGPGPRAGPQLRELYPDRVAMQDATAQMALLQFMTAGLAAGGGAVHGALRPPHPGPRRRRGRPARRRGGQPGGLRLPAHGLGQVRHRLLEAGLGHHPPGRARAVRLPRRDDDRHRQPHAQRRRPRHGRHRRGRRRRGRRDDRRHRSACAGPSSSASTSPASSTAGPRPRTSSSRWPRSSPSRAAPAPSSSTSAPARASISATGKATICNMGAEIGATTSLFPYDEPWRRLPQGHRPRGDRRPRPTRCAEHLRADPDVVGDPEPLLRPGHRDRPVDARAPLNGPHTPDLARPVSQHRRRRQGRGLAAADQLVRSSARAPTRPTRTSPAPRRIARQAAAAGLRVKTQLLVTPGSERVRATIERDGLLADLEAIGATVLANACGPCIGQWRARRRERRATST